MNGGQRRKRPRTDFMGRMKRGRHCLVLMQQLWNTPQEEREGTPVKKRHTQARRWLNEQQGVENVFAHLDDSAMDLRDMDRKGRQFRIRKAPKKPKRCRDPNRRAQRSVDLNEGRGINALARLRQRVEPCAYEHPQHEQRGRPVQAKREAVERLALGADWHHVGQGEVAGLRAGRYTLAWLLDGKVLLHDASPLISRSDGSERLSTSAYSRRDGRDHDARCHPFISCCDRVDARQALPGARDQVGPEAKN
jgi:hypothetical protein